MEYEKKTTAPDPAVGAAAEQSSYVSTRMILPETRMEIKANKIRYGDYAFRERRAGEQGSI